MTYGEKIAKLRKSNNMTQTELGELLNVSFQAVSKWEKGLSEPDLNTIKRICEIFRISVNEFFDLPVPETAATAQTVAQPVIQEVPRIVYGYCEDCKKPLYTPEEYTVIKRSRGHIQHLYCKDCDRKRLERLAEAEKEKRKTQRKRGFIFGAIGGLVLSLVLIFAGITLKDVRYSVIGGILGIYGGFAFVSQMFWGNSVVDLLGFFIKAFHLPGVIFTLDLDGIIFLILFKVIGGFLCGLLSLMVFGFGLIITIFYSMFSFPVAVVKQLRGDY